MANFESDQLYDPDINSYSYSSRERNYKGFFPSENFQRESSKLRDSKAMPEVGNLDIINIKDDATDPTTEFCHCENFYHNQGRNDNQKEFQSTKGDDEDSKDDPTNENILVSLSEHLLNLFVHNHLT